MPRLPTPGSDDGTWGDVLNDFLSQEHNADGTQKTLPIAKGGTGATDAATARANLIPNGTYVGSGSVAINPKDPAYGALGDGVTNDGAAIVLADAAARAGRGAVRFPAGTYLVDSGVLTIGSNTLWVAEEGAVVIIKLKNGAAANSSIINVIGGAVNVRISNLTIEGNRTNQSTSNNRGVQIDAGASDVEVDSCLFQNIRGSAVKAKTGPTGSACSNIRIHHNVVYNCGIDTQYVLQFGYDVLRSSICDNYIYSGGPNCQAIGISNGSNGCTISRNTIDQPSWMGIEVYNCNDVLVSNNHVTRTGATGISIAFVDRANVVGNKLYDIGLTISLNSGQGIEIAGGRQVLVSGNHIEYVHGDTTHSVGIVNWQSNAPSARAGNDVTITGNHVKDTDAAGIAILNAAQRSTIVGNTVSGALHGIQASGNTYTVINSNNVYGTTATCLYLDNEYYLLATANSVHAAGGAVAVATNLTSAIIRNNQGYTAVDEPDADTFAIGETNMRRRDLNTASIATGSGTLRLGFFTARKTATITQMRVVSGATAAGATPTLCRFGLYSVATNGDIALVASIPNDITLFATANTSYTRTISSSYVTVAGTRYAIGVLVVTAATAPSLLGASLAMGTEAGLAPRLCAAVFSQSDLPSSVAVASLGDTTQNPYGALLP